MDNSKESFRYKYLFSLSQIADLKEAGNFKKVAAQVEEYFGIKIGEEKEGIRINMSTPDFEVLDPVEMMAGRNFLSFEYSRRICYTFRQFNC